MIRRISLICLSILWLSFVASDNVLAQDEDDKEPPGEQVPIQERDMGDNFIEILGEVPGKVITLPVSLFFKGLAKAAGFVDYNDIILRITDILTNEDGTRKVRPVFTPVSGGGLIFIQDNLFKNGMNFRAAASFGIRTRRNFYGKLRDTQLFAPKLGLQISGFYKRLPDEDFFGIGNNSFEANQTNYLHDESNFELEFLTGPFGRALIGAGFSLSNVNIQEGKDPNVPTLDSLFTANQIPGFSGADMWTLLFRVYRDTRNVTGHPTCGGEAFFSYEYSQQLDGSEFGYSKFTLDVRHYFELFYQRVIALRFRTEITDNIGQNKIPFFRLGALGGSEILRGYRSVRFRDKDLMLGGIEYIWPIHAMASVYGFFEEGRVFTDVFDDFTFNDFKYSVGGGFRIKAPDGTLTAILEFGKSDEQFRINFVLNRDLGSF
ncbi:BamA/TamA family outer membrane protein [candidate division KSB1 bacterium]|nr:BamA/TamA family outer membrane protein [candidate division KSB1 bacterium]